MRTIEPTLVGSSYLSEWVTLDPKNKTLKYRGRSYDTKDWRYFRITSVGPTGANHPNFSDCEPLEELKPKKGYWTDDLTRLAEAKKIRTVSGAKLRVKVEEFANTDFLINFKQFDFSECYKSNGKVKYEGNSHPLDIKEIWLRNDK